jgi:hypothetical protein
MVKPTAAHWNPAVQDTAWRLALLVSAGVTVQAEPFHCSAKGALRDLPTVMQAVAVGQETPHSPSTWVPDVGVTTTDHAVPFHFSASVPPLAPTPIAQQSLTVTHDTPLVSPCFGTPGTRTIAHARPFQRSNSGPGSDLPTAQQLAVPEHDTESGWVEAAVAGLGMAVTDHRAPFQCSA